MRIAQEGAYLLPGIDRAGGVERAARKMHGVGERRREERPLPFGAHLFEIQQHDQEIQQVAGQVAVVPGNDEPSHGVVFHDALRHVVQRLGVHRLSDKPWVLFQDGGEIVFPALFPLPEVVSLQRPQKVVPPELPVGPKVVVGQLRLLGEPVALVLLRAVIPAVRQVGWAKLVRANRHGGEELVVEFSELLRLLLAHVGDVQSVAVAPENVPVVRPAHAALRHPAQALAHGAGEDDVHVFDPVLHAPQIGDGAGAAAGQEAVKIHLVEHPLDVGQANLERGVDVPAAQHPVDLRGKPGRDQPLAIEADDGHVHLFLHPVIFPSGVLGAVVLHSDDGNQVLGAGAVLHDNDPVGTVNVHAVDARAAGQHQAVIGVQLGELALVNVHAQHDAAAHRVMEVCADEGQPRLTAHAAGALESHITAGAGTEVQSHALGTEHGPGFLLAYPLFFAGGAAVKDTVEVHVEDGVGQVGDELPIAGFGVTVTTQDAHGLEEQGIAVLLVGGRSAFAFLRRQRAEIEGVAICRLHGVTHHRTGGQLKDLVSGLRHSVTSRQ